VRVRAAVVALGLVARAAPAAAQHPRGSSSLARQFDGCMALLNQLRAAEAVECWRALRQETDAPAVQYSLGMSLRALGRNRAAIATLEEFLARAEGEGALADYARRARQAVADLRFAMAHLALTTLPEDARATLDGAELPRTPGGFAADADPGEHIVVVQAPGYVTDTQAVTLASSATARLDVTLVAAVSTGHLRVEAEPDTADILIDGALAGHGRVDETMRSGPHRVTVTAHWFGTFERSVEVTRGATVSVRAVLPDERPLTSRRWFRVTLGVGLTAVVAGLVVGGIALFSSTEDPYRGAVYDIPPSGR
jgi:hypothetical protein